MIGSRQRKLLEASGEQRLLVVRRLRCAICRKIHHELPDCIVPYKRYESECVESVVASEPEEIVVAADHSTLYRLRSWFWSQTTHWMGCLESIAIRFRLDVAEGPSVPSQTVHHRFGRFVGDAAGWLGRVVRSVANSNFWVHTRSAFLSEAR